MSAAVENISLEESGESGRRPIAKIHNSATRILWRRFLRNKLSILGLLIVVTVIILAVFAPLIAPYPEHAGVFADFINANQPPSQTHPFGTDKAGRDVLTRILFSLQGALLQCALVLVLAVPFGIFLGLIAGYFRDSIIDTIIMRISDIFLSIPALILAMAIAAVLSPSIFNSTLALAIMWWPWYTRIVYSIASSLRNEYFVYSAELIGASHLRIIMREILPNCISPVLTKMSLDVGWVILATATLNYIGLGVQPPEPSLGQMVAEGRQLIPNVWWVLVFPASTITLIILGFNLLGDGISEMLRRGDDTA
jgi:peptide/nickel transport system permease protein